MTLASLRFAAAAVLGIAPAVAAAADDLIRIESDAPVAETLTRLTEAVETAGAKVFVAIDHQAGAESAGIVLRPTTLVLLGNPKIGAAALTDAQTMGIEVPLRVLVYEDADGKVWLAYADPADLAARHGLAPDHPAVGRMQGALERLTNEAAS